MIIIRSYVLIMNKLKQNKGRKKLFAIFNDLDELNSDGKYSQIQLWKLAKELFRISETEYIDKEKIREIAPRSNYYTINLVDAFTKDFFKILKNERKKYYNYEDNEYISNNNYRSFSYYNNLV